MSIFLSTFVLRGLLALHLEGSLKVNFFLKKLKKAQKSFLKKFTRWWKISRIFINTTIIISFIISRVIVFFEVIGIFSNSCWNTATCWIQINKKVGGFGWKIVSYDESAVKARASFVKRASQNVVVWGINRSTADALRWVLIPMRHPQSSPRWKKMAASKIIQISWTFFIVFCSDFRALFYALIIFCVSIAKGIYWWCEKCQIFNFFCKLRFFSRERKSWGLSRKNSKGKLTDLREWAFTFFSFFNLFQLTIFALTTSVIFSIINFKMKQVVRKFYF